MPDVLSVILRALSFVLLFPAAGLAIFVAICGRQLELLDCVRLLNDEGVTILAAMHDLQLIPGVFSSVLLLGPDQEVRKGDPQDLLQPDILGRAFDCPPRRHPKLVVESRVLLEKAP